MIAAMIKGGVRLLLGAGVIVVSVFTLPLDVRAAAQSIPPNARFAWQLTGSLQMGALDSESGNKVYDLDPDIASATQIASLKSKGVTVICYFSAGSAEDWRSDYGKFTSADKAGALDGWAGEYVVNVTQNVKNIMTARMQRFQNMGCDGVEPDNTDQVADPVSYIKFLSGAAHSLGLSVALKNNAELAGDPTVISAVDFAVVEQCYEFGECGSYLPLIKAGKAVFDIEYNTNPNCADANSKNIDAYRMNLDLSGVRTPCRTSGGPASAPVPSTGTPAGGNVAPTGTSAPTPPKPPKCTILPQTVCDAALDTSTEKGGMFLLLKLVLRILTGGVGVLAVAAIVWAGILYGSAGDDAAQTKKAKTIMRDVAIGIVAYSGMILLTQWLIPGGVF